MIAALLASLVIAPPAALPHRPGWHIGTARIANASCRRCVQMDSWAATVPYRDTPNDFPHHTMATLGRHDLIIQITRSWEPSAPRWEFQRRPLHIVSTQIHANFEGNTTHGRVSRWDSSTWRNGSFVTVYVFFGSPSPQLAAIDRAQRELDDTRFAPWSITNH
jgi:hypothetical protein